MYTPAEQSTTTKSKAQGGPQSTAAALTDNRPETTAQRKLQQMLGTAQQSKYPVQLMVAGGQVIQRHVKEVATKLIEEKKTKEINELLLQIQQERATGAPGPADAGEAEMLCMSYLQAQTILIPGGPSGASKVPRQKPAVLHTIPAMYQEAIQLGEEARNKLLGANEEEIIVNALNQATKSLFFEMKFKGGFDLFPHPDTLNTDDDLARERDKMIMRHREKDTDDYSHVFQKMFPGQSEDEDKMKEMVDAEPLRAKPLFDKRFEVANGKFADTWLKYAQPYVDLKKALYDGWEKNEHGSIQKRGFLYILKRSPKTAEEDTSGRGDKQAAITEPSSGKVALAMALKEVFNSVSCHEDAINFVNLLGSSVTAKGELRQDKGGDHLLPAMKINILQQLEACPTIVMGVRLRDSNHHSLVLLFERTKEGLFGTKFESVAGRNTEQVLAFTEDVNMLSAAEPLIEGNLTKAIQQSKPGWILEWEVFSVKDPAMLRENLRAHHVETLGGVREGLAMHKEDENKTISVMGMGDMDDGREEMLYPEAEAHVQSVIGGKGDYIRRKEERERLESEQSAMDEQRIQELISRFKPKLLTARAGGNAAIKEVTDEMFANGMKEDDVFKLTMTCRIDNMDEIDPARFGD